MTVLFIIAGLMAIVGALGVVLAKQPVHQVLATILNFLGLAALYLSLSAEFMAVVQLIVYGGAVMILFLFVIALLTVRKDPMEREVDQLHGQRILGFSIGGAVLVMLALVGLSRQIDATQVAAVDANFGSVKNFGEVLLKVHVLPFETTAFVLMVAVIGVVILVGRTRT
jgi:NADH-quinone oxidoreductase subunit J